MMKAQAQQILTGGKQRPSKNSEMRKPTQSAWYVEYEDDENFDNFVELAYKYKFETKRQQFLQNKQRSRQWAWASQGKWHHQYAQRR